MNYTKEELQEALKQLQDAYELALAEPTLVN